MEVITSLWPFAQWGMDFLGPFPQATGQRKFILVAVDYFTKWVEAEPLAKITEKNVEAFVWKSIISRFGIPRVIITDNQKQFDCSAFRKFCTDYGIENRYTSVGYPQANGQAEVTNRVILLGLKKRLEEAKGLWVEELPSVLWSYRTTKRSATGETPFNLAYGTEAMIPVEIGMPTYRVLNFNETDNSNALRTNLDLLEETREQTELRVAAYQQRIARFHNSRVKGRLFRTGDLVLRKMSVSDPEAAQGKLSANWEGPYKVSEVVRPGTYRLKRLDGVSIPRTWNAQNLRAYHQ